MTVYVDELINYGWKLRGHIVSSCHMISDNIDLQELHDMAKKIGMKREWFQDKPNRPHYDLTASRRAKAVEFGVQEISQRELVLKLRERRVKIDENKSDWA